MEDLGVTAEVVNNHRSLVIEWIVKAINGGVFQELAPVEATEVAETAPILDSYQISAAETMHSEMQPIYPLSKLDTDFWSLPPSSEAYNVIHNTSNDHCSETKAKLKEWSLRKRPILLINSDSV